MTYNKLVEELFFDTRHAGELDCTKPLTVCSRISVAKNQRSELYLACDSKGLIIAVSFKASGDPYVIAGFECLCRKIENTVLEEHPYIEYSILVDELAIPKIQYAAALLVETTYRQAVDSLKRNLLEAKGKI